MNVALVESRPKRRRRRLQVTAAAALAAMVPMTINTTPADATIVQVADTHNITVFHNIDFVAVFGYEPGEVLTVQVVRNGTVIGTATGPARGAAPEVGLEVNHGPVGAPLAGDCWEGNVPNIRPGDHVRVTSPSGSDDEVVVDNIRFGVKGPQELANGDIVVPFKAFRANGDAIAPGVIDSAEFRAPSNNKVRFEANRVIVERRPGALPGQLRMRYKSPFRPSRNDSQNPFNQRQLRRALLGDGHAVGFGHVAVLPREAMLVDGLTDTPGPALGCPAG
ncbi:MAG TPA: hypothetical protein VFI99_01510 [Nocardioides sp.]|nr:hypothetical protein [Nocardioides sp.]